MIECMKTSMHLLEISSGRRGPHGFVEDSQMITWEMDVEAYLLYGGWHPSLLRGEPDSASEKYLSPPWL